MNVYKIQSGEPEPDYDVRMTTVHLPIVHCEVCGRTRAEPGVYHPTIGCDQALLKRIKNLPRLLSVVAFADFKSTLPSYNVELFDVQPGSQLGKHRIVVDSPPGDFLYDINLSLISEKALEVLAESGVQVYNGPVEVLLGRKSLTGWRAVDFPNVKLMTAKARKVCGIEECSHCGDIIQTEFPNPREQRLGSSDHELIRKEWPLGVGVARLSETSWYVPSPEFIEVWTENHFTGISFVPIGEWV